MQLNSHFTEDIYILHGYTDILQAGDMANLDVALCCCLQNDPC